MNYHTVDTALGRFYTTDRYDVPLDRSFRDTVSGFAAMDAQTAGEVYCWKRSSKLHFEDKVVTKELVEREVVAGEYFIMNRIIEEKGRELNVAFKFLYSMKLWLSGCRDLMDKGEVRQGDSVEVLGSLLERLMDERLFAVENYKFERVAVMQEFNWRRLECRALISEIRVLITKLSPPSDGSGPSTPETQMLTRRPSLDDKPDSELKN